MGLVSYVSLLQSSDSFPEFLSLPGVSAFPLLLSIGQFSYLLNHSEGVREDVHGDR